MQIAHSNPEIAEIEKRFAAGGMKTTEDWSAKQKTKEIQTKGFFLVVRENTLLLLLRLNEWNNCETPSTIKHIVLPAP